MTLKNNRAPLLCYFKLCASFRSHLCIQTGVRVRKRLSWVLTSVTLTFDLWPWPFAWTSLFTMVITPENFMMIRWWEHGEKGVTDGQTDGRTDRQTENTICRAAWSQLKNWITNVFVIFTFHAFLFYSFWANLLFKTWLYLILLCLCNDFVPWPGDKLMIPDFTIRDSEHCWWSLLFHFHLRWRHASIEAFHVTRNSTDCLNARSG